MKRSFVLVSHPRWENLAVFTWYLQHCCLFSILIYHFLVVFVCSILRIPSCAHSSLKTLISWSICLATNLLLCLRCGRSCWFDWLVVWELNLFSCIIVHLRRSSTLSNSHGDTDLIVILSIPSRLQFLRDIQQLQLLPHRIRILVVHCLNWKRGNKGFMTEDLKMLVCNCMCATGHKPRIWKGNEC